jgi:hypothetical protein
MADADDVGTAASGVEEVAGQVKSMFKFGSGKHATIFVKALELSRRTLADDEDRLVADFVSGGRASDPRMVLLIRNGSFRNTSRSEMSCSRAGEKHMDFAPVP